MKKEIIIGASVLMAAFMVLNVIPFSSSGALVQPCTAWGDISIDGGANETVSHTMTVWIDGVAYGTDASTNDGAGGTWYVAEMVCAGNDTSYAEKSGGMNGDQMYYTLDDTGPYVANEAYSFTSGVTYGDVTFNYVTTAQPTWGKINEVVNDNNGYDYVYLYFPTAPTLADYRIEDNSGNSVAITTAVQAVDWAETNMYYLNLSALGYDVPAIGTLKLAWIDTGGITGGGNWIAIDRVEFGHTAITDPGMENTIHPDFNAGTGIVAGNSAIRTTNGTDTDDSSVDFSLRAGNPTPPYEPDGGVAITPSWIEVQRDFPGNNNVLVWENAGSTEYNVYATNDKFTWDFGTPLTTTAGTSFTHAGALMDTLDWYYIVRGSDGAGTEDVNSHVAYQIDKFFDYDSARSGQKAWISMPWNTPHISTAQELIYDMNNQDTNLPNITSVDKWAIGTQSTTNYKYDSVFGMWIGTNFPIESGSGYYTLLTTDFTWYVNGTDNGVGPVFFDYDSTRSGQKVWFSPSFDGDYTDAQGLIYSLNNQDTNLPNITSVDKWAIGTQSTTNYKYDSVFGMWIGTNWAVTPVDGYYTILSVDFDWSPEPVNP